MKAFYDRRRMMVGVSAGVLLVASLAAGWANWPGATARVVVAASPVNPYVAAGALDYVTFGCTTCHGPDGKGGVRVPNVSGLTTIPALNASVVREKISFQSLSYIIEHGIVLPNNTTKVYMPVWGTVMSSRQISDLVTFIKAGMPQFTGISEQTVRTDLGLRVEGQQLYIRYGCVVCHAFNGFGGVPNPSAPDRVIPPLRGTNFDSQFASDGAISYVIQHGSVIGQAPIASMPVWSGLLSNQQISALIAYIRSFR